MNANFDVTGMSCAACQAHVEKAVNALEGVDNAAVNLLANSMVAEFDESKLLARGYLRRRGQGGLPRQRSRRLRKHSAPASPSRTRRWSRPGHEAPADFVHYFPGTPVLSVHGPHGGSPHSPHLSGGKTPWYSP